MASSTVDRDQQWLLNCLSATLDPSHDVRAFAEASLQQASLQPGFGSALSKVAANRELQFGLRQLAAVLLKQFIKKHWQEGEDSFEHPLVSSDEKAVIRKYLLMTLDDSHRKICTAVSMAVASIAVYDWPEDWPELLPNLLMLINDQTNMKRVQGALKCLSLLSEDLDDTVVPTLVPILFPTLHKIVSSPQSYDKHLRAKALSIVYSCVSVLGAMSGVYKSETTEMINSFLKPWMDEFNIILREPVPSEDPDDWSIRMEVLKCLNQLIQNFPSIGVGEFVVIMGPLWQTFVSTLEVYLQSSIKGQEYPYQGSYDSDGAEKSLDFFIIQLFEFLLTIVSSRKFVKVMMNNINELVYYTLAFLQMTEQQVHTWSEDANEFVANEDDLTYSCRVSGALLLEEVVSSCGREGVDAIIEAAKRRFAESVHDKSASSTGWWRMREAILFALASLSEQLLEAEVSGLVSGNIGSLIEQMISEDIGAGVHEYPFLYARIFVSVAKFSSVISRGVLDNFLYASITTVSMDVPPPVKVGACHALSLLLTKANEGIVLPHIIGLLSSLTNLLSQASDETLHLVLETIRAAIMAGCEAIVAVEPNVSPILLNTWASNISDPFVSGEALEVLEAIKNSPGCVHPLISRVLPFVGPVLNTPQQQPDGLVAGSLDLLTMLLKNSPIDAVKLISDACFDAVIRIILQSEDHGEMQNATECLAAFVSGGRQDVLAWGGDSGFTMRSLLDVASRLLDPALESSGSLFVGNYILQLILHLPQQIAPHIWDMAAALVRRMQSAEIAGLRTSLILIFARLVHISVPNVQQFIDMLMTVPAEGYDNAFTYVMSEWTKLQGEIQGSYQIKVTTTALALLLSTMHGELGKINVQGYLIQSATGITTRLKAKSAPDQWTLMPLPAKILALLADALIEIQEQAPVGDEEEDSEWEEVEPADGDKDILRAAAAVSSDRPGYAQFEAMARVFDEEDGDDDDLSSIDDPINKVNLANYLVDFLIKFSESNRNLFDHLWQNLTQSQRTAIQAVLGR
ncbi:importin-9 isoform X1 [Rhodamnia argentea]|uniref:Importin-9 isoform X1 n=1 Tax=Rhodamnia argentea TaxID=178133 RepID=A0A8B8MRN5_9MYRT|nr:importin-9 isoform X1 [Rhodamnia argentea]